jgi:hypothetical protein
VSAKVRGFIWKKCPAVHIPVANAIPPATTGEDRHHEHARYEPGSYEVVDWIGGAHSQGIDLFRDDHRTDFRRNPRSDPRREHQGAYGRRQVADEHFEERGAELGHVRNHAPDLQPRLIDEDHSHEPHRYAEEQSGAVAYFVKLLGDGAGLWGAAERVVERQSKDPNELETRRLERPKALEQLRPGAGRETEHFVERCPVFR